MKDTNASNTTSKLLEPACTGFNGLSCLEEVELERVTFLISLAFFMLVIAFLWLLAYVLFVQVVNLKAAVQALRASNSLEGDSSRLLEPPPTVRSSFSSKKPKKTTFADTSCTTPRDVDQEDL